MTEAELKRGIGNGRLANEVHKFYGAGKKATGRVRTSKVAAKSAWEMYVEAVASIPYPTKGKNVKLLSEEVKPVGDAEGLCGR